MLVEQLSKRPKTTKFWKTHGVSKEQYQEYSWSGNKTDEMKELDVEMSDIFTKKINLERKIKDEMRKKIKEQVHPIRKKRMKLFFQSMKLVREDLKKRGELIE